MVELGFLQENIARFDSNGMTIKSWCITTWAGITVYSLNHESLNTSLVAPLVVAGFFSIEFVYRVYQARFISRTKAIESILRRGSWNEYQYSLNETASTPIHAEIRSTMGRPVFNMFYLVFALISIAILSILVAP